MEEDTSSVNRGHAGKFSTIKFSRGEACTAGASDREETCPAPARGNQTHSTEDTWKTACPNCVEASGRAECIAPSRWSQTS